MKLEKLLKKNGFDYIDSPSRNHRIGQLWKIEGSLDRKAVFYTEKAENLFKEIPNFTTDTSNSLDVNSSNNNEYRFNLGLTALEGLLQNSKIADANLGLLFTNGRTISISYKSAETIQIPLSEIEAYFSKADVKDDNRPFINNLNQEKVIIISELLIGKGFEAQITTSSEISAAIKAKILEIIDGKLDVSYKGNSKLILNSPIDVSFPIAVKAHRLKYERNIFSKLTLITDTARLF